MNHRRFDALACAVTRDRSRRSTLRLLAGGVLGGLLTALGVPRAEARHAGCRHVGKRCRRDGQCCSGRCKREKCRAPVICSNESQNVCGADAVRCGATGTCFCFVTTTGAFFCGSSNQVVNCTVDAQCVPIRGAGAVCAPCAGETLCVSPCPFD